MRRRAFVTGAMALTVSACTLGRGAAEMAHYDLGTELPAASPRRLPGSIALDEVSAGGWLQTNAILYRLAYRETAQLQAYTQSRWTESAAALMTARLRRALNASTERGVTMVADGVPTDHVLKVSLDTFEQWVQSPSASRAVVDMRAVLIDGKSRSLQASYTFRLEEPCPSVDAEGAVRALRTASDRTIAALIEWLATAGRKSQ